MKIPFEYIIADCEIKEEYRQDVTAPLEEIYARVAPQGWIIAGYYLFPGSTTLVIFLVRPKAQPAQLAA